MVSRCRQLIRRRLPPCVTATGAVLWRPRRRRAVWSAARSPQKALLELAQAGLVAEIARLTARVEHAVAERLGRLDDRFGRHVTVRVSEKGTLS